MKKCEIKWCRGEAKPYIVVSEVIGDGAWNTTVCANCASAIGVKEGDTLPEPDEVQKRLRNAK